MILNLNQEIHKITNSYNQTGNLLKLKVLGQIALSINGNLIHNGELINNDKATLRFDVLGNTNINNKITINDPQQGIEIKSANFKTTCLLLQVF